MDKIKSFKAYDIRGKVPAELNSELAYKVGRAYGNSLNTKKIVIGHDIRKSSMDISNALSKGLNESGSDVIDIGLCGTEMIYFGTIHFDADGGIMITASHNPPEYNGMKFVKRNSVPVGYNSGLNEIEKMILNGNLGEKSKITGKISNQDIMKEFMIHLKKFYNAEKIKPFKVVVNAGNGCAGLALNAIENDLPIKMIKVFNEPDSNFPNGVPNPLLPENRQVTYDAVKSNNADLGVAWDGDYGPPKEEASAAP